MPLTLAIANQKGGAGKTSTTINLASLLSRQGKRVLVIDTDPQGNTTTILGVDVADHQITLNDVLDSVLAGRAGAGDLTAAVAPAGTSWPNIDVIPADRQLAARDADTRPGREAALRLAAEGATDDYDVVLIDCPPSLGVLALGALTAADRVLVVTEPRVSSVDGVAELLATTQDRPPLLQPHADAGRHRHQPLALGPRRSRRLAPRTARDLPRQHHRPPAARARGHRDGRDQRRPPPRQRGPRLPGGTSRRR